MTVLIPILCSIAYLIIGMSVSITLFTDQYKGNTKWDGDEPLGVIVVIFWPLMLIVGIGFGLAKIMGWVANKL